MGRVTSPLGLLVQAEMAKEGVMRDLRRRAMKLSNWHEEDAKDLLAKSLARVLDESDQPFRAGTHTFAAHMFVVMRQTQYRLWRRTEKEAEVLESGQAEGTAGDERPRDDDQLERMRSLAVLRMLGPRVLAELGSDRLARQVYETTMKEDLDPAEARTRFNCTTEELQAALKRLKYHAKKVFEAWEASEERRMSAVREQARTQNEEDSP